MAQDYFTDNSAASNHILAKRRSVWTSDGWTVSRGSKVSCLAELKNGWFIYKNMSPKGFADQLLARVEEMLNQRQGNSIKVFAYLESSSGQHGIRNYSKDQVMLL